MKKNILLTLSLIQLTHTAQADFGIPGVFRVETPTIRIPVPVIPPPPTIRIETPQVLKDINNGANNAGSQIANGANNAGSQLANGANNAGTQLSNGVRDGVAKTAENVKAGLAAVGNATGISDIIDSNAETLSNIGRANACLYAFCMSEKLRGDQIDEAQREAKNKTESMKAKLLESARTGNRAEYDKTLNDAKKVALIQIDFATKRYEILNKEKKSLLALKAAVAKELDFRRRVHAAKIQLPAVSKTEMVSPSQEFQNNQKSDISEALSKLNHNLAAISQSSGRNQGQLLAEFMRIVEVSTLQDLGKYYNNQTSLLNQEIRLVSTQKQQAEAKLKSIEQALLAESK